MAQRKPLLMLGAGDQAAAFVLGYRDNPDYEFAGFVQDTDPGMTGRTLEGLPVYSVEEALALRGTHAAISCIGSPAKRRLIGKFEAAGFEFARMISPLALVDATAVVEPGCIINHYASLDARVRIGRHTIIARRCLIAHHVQVGAYGMVSSCSMIAGGTRVGDECFIGMGAVVKDHLTIGNGATVGLGAVVVEDVAAGETVAGNPARPLAGQTAASRREPGRRKPLLLLGAGGMARNYAEVFRDHPEYEIAGFVRDGDGDAGCRDATLAGRPVYTTEAALGMSATHHVICCIGSSRKREMVERFEAAGFRFATMISPSARVERTATIGEGCFVNHDASIGTYTKIGAHTMVMRKVVFGHHSSIGPYGTLGPGAMIGGTNKIGAGCFIGIGAVLKDHLTLGDGATVGAGAVVVDDVADGETVAGNPARPVVRKAARIPLLILGAGEQAASHAENASDHPLYEVAGFVQDADPALRGTMLEGRPVYWIDEVAGWRDTHRVVCCVGSMKKRALIRKFDAMGFRFATVIATTAVVSPKAKLGAGCFVSHTGQVAPFAEVGPHTMIGRMTMVGHHSTVGAFSLIAGSSVIGGGARIGEGCYIGMGALVRDHITIGDGATVGVGAVVVKDVPPGATVAGNPAREIERK